MAEATALREVRRRGRPSAALSAQITDDILTVAADMFVEHGYEATSMDAVANRLSMPKTTLYKRYSDKSDMLRAAIEARAAKWSESINERRTTPLADNLEERLAGHLTTLMCWTTRPEVKAMSRLASYLPETNGQGLPGRSLWGYRSMHATLVDAIVTLGPAAGVHAKAPEEIADLLMALVSGTVAMRTDPAPIGAEEGALMAGKLVSRLLRGAQSW